MKPKIETHDLVRETDLKETFSKGDSSNWSYNFYKTAENVIDTIPRYGIDNLPERYIKALLQARKISMKENKGDLKTLNINIPKRP